MTAIIDTSNTLFILNSLTHSSLSSSSLAHSLLFSVLVTYSLTHSILFLPDGTQGCTKPLFWLHADILHFTFTYTSCISAPRLTCKKAEAHTAARHRTADKPPGSAPPPRRRQTISTPLIAA